MKHLSSHCTLSSRTFNENRLAIDLQGGGMRVKSGEVKEHSSHPPGICRGLFSILQPIETSPVSE